MVYKDGIRFKIRKVSEIKADILEARDIYGKNVSKFFFLPKIQ